MTREEWRPVEGFLGYEVSNLGRVRSHLRGEPRILRGGSTPKGYRLVCLRRDGQDNFVIVHRLVARIFLGPCPEGMQVRHLDGDQLNNAASNLRYGTQSENNYDQVRHGTHPWASRTHCKQGHPFDEQNTLRRRDGGRRCRECRRQSRLRTAA